MAVTEDISHAEKMVEAGEFDGALQCISKLRINDPDNLRIIALHVKCSIQLNDVPSAQALFELASV